MTFQDEFIHRLRVVRGEATGDGRSTGSGRTDTDQDKPLLFRGGGTRGGGDADASLASAKGGGADGGGLEPQQRHPDERNHPNPSFEEEGLEGEDAADNSVRLERSRETGDGGDVSRPGPALSACQSRQTKGSTRMDGDGEDTRHPEFISGPRTAEPEDRGKRDGVLNRVQDDREPNTVRPEPVEGPLSTGNCPSTRSGRTETDNIPSPTRHDGWPPELRVKFLEALAQTGNVQASAYFVQRTRQSAYDLKRRDPDFARGWLAALVLAREEAQDKLQERAILGVEEEIFYHGEVVATRRRYDSRLLLAHLARLDRVAEQIPAQRGAARFGDMLDAIGKGEDTAPLIATPTEDELAVLAAAAEAGRQPEPPPEDDGDEFYAVTFPDHDGPPDYYRMTPEEAAQMKREVPGLTAEPTGTADDAVISIMAHHAEALAEYPLNEGEEGMNL